MMEIVFDIGNVIFEWNPRKLVTSLFSRDAEREDAIENIIEHEDWQMLDKGMLSLDAAISRARDRCFLSIDQIRKLFAETPKQLIPIQEMFHVVLDLSTRGYRLYVLSNMHRHSFEYLSAAYSIWNHFSGIVISSHIKSIKPEPEIFKYLIVTYNLKPSNTVFLDDLKSNIEAAASFGLQTVHVQSASQSKAALYRMIGI